MKRKKKGRPSLLDLQKRALKQQQLLQRRNPNEENEEELRSSSRNPNFSNRSNRRRNSNSEDDDDERRDKKHRLLHGLNSHEGRDSSNSKSGGGDLDSDARNRRKIDGSDNTVVIEYKNSIFIWKFIWGKKVLILGFFFWIFWRVNWGSSASLNMVIEWEWWVLTISLFFVGGKWEIHNFSFFCIFIFIFRFLFFFFVLVEKILVLIFSSFLSEYYIIFFWFWY